MTNDAGSTEDQDLTESGRIWQDLQLHWRILWAKLRTVASQPGPGLLSHLIYGASPFDLAVAQLNEIKPCNEQKTF